MNYLILISHGEFLRWFYSTSFMTNSYYCMKNLQLYTFLFRFESLFLSPFISEISLLTLIDLGHIHIYVKFSFNFQNCTQKSGDLLILVKINKNRGHLSKTTNSSIVDIYSRRISPIHSQIKCPPYVYYNDMACMKMSLYA